MSYVETKNKSLRQNSARPERSRRGQAVAPQSAIIPVSELDRMSREYQSALVKTAELIKINDERDKLFSVMKENFDILFEEVEALKRELVEKNTLIERLQKEIKRLKTLKNVRKRLKQYQTQGEFVDLAVDLDE